MKIRDCVLLLGVLCLLVGSEALPRGGGSRSGSRGKGGGGWSIFRSGTSSSRSGKVSSSRTSKIASQTPVKAQPPPGFHSNNPAHPGAPPPYPAHSGHPPSYGWNAGPPPPYPGTGHNYGWNVGPPPPYPGLSGGLSNHGGYGNHAPPPYPGYPSGYGHHNSGGGSDFVNGMLIGHSLSSLSRDRSYHHYYYPHSYSHHTRNNNDRRYTVEHVNSDGTTSYSSYFGNTTCVATYNADRVSKWANKTLKAFYKSHPNHSLLLLLNSTSIGLNISDIITRSTNFTVVQGRIIHNETISVTCCGTNKGQINLNKLISDKDNSVNCVYNTFVVPFKKLKFIPVTNNTNTDNSTTNTNTEVPTTSLLLSNNTNTNSTSMNSSTTTTTSTTEISSSTTVDISTFRLQ